MKLLLSDVVIGIIRYYKTKNCIWAISKNIQYIFVYYIYIVGFLPTRGEFQI